MPEYIDKSVVLDQISKQKLFYEEERKQSGDCLEEMNCVGEDVISDIPAADVAPVVHGEWMRYSRTLWHYCSVCLEDALMSKSTGTEVLSSFCPHCGAKIDLEDD